MGAGYTAQGFAAKYGLRSAPAAAAMPAPSTMTTAARMTGPSTDDAAAATPWHPDSPLFALGAIVAVTAGLLAFSASARVGKTRVAASVGDTGK